MNFEFSIPLCRDDLLTRTEVEDYVVDEVYSMRMLPSQLQGRTSECCTSTVKPSSIY